MGIAVAITREDRTAAELRAISAKSGDAAQARRLLAMAMILDETSRLDAARLTGMDRQTLRDWVHRRHGTTTYCMTIPGVGPVVALAYMSVIDDPQRFDHARTSVPILA